jgi:hypothetical protein
MKLAGPHLSRHHRGSTNIVPASFLTKSFREPGQLCPVPRESVCCVAAARSVNQAAPLEDGGLPRRVTR